MKGVANTSADESYNTQDMSCLDEEVNICPPRLERTDSVMLQAADLANP